MMSSGNTQSFLLQQILAAQKLNEISVKSCPARECATTDAIENAERILEEIDERWPTECGKPCD